MKKILYWFSLLEVERWTFDVQSLIKINLQYSKISSVGKV